MLTLSTGFVDLDDITCGLQPSELVIVAARPGMGKTSFVLNILEHVGVEQEKAAVLFSLEMSAQQIAQNMICSHAKLDPYKMRRGMLQKSQWDEITMAIATLSDAPLFYR